MSQQGIQKAKQERLPEKLGSYFARHWRGNLSLPRSWWVNDVILQTLGCNLLVIAAVFVVLLSFHSQSSFLNTLAVGELLNTSVLIWALVGTWRAAGRYQGPHVWSTLSRIGMCLGVVISVGIPAEILMEWHRLVYGR